MDEKRKCSNFGQREYFVVACLYRGFVGLGVGELVGNLVLLFGLHVNKHLFLK